MNATDRLLQITRYRTIARRAAKKAVRPEEQFTEHMKDLRAKHAKLVDLAADYSQSSHDEWCKSIAWNYIDEARDLRTKFPHVFTRIP